MDSNGRWITEEAVAAPFPLLVHREWAERWPWLVQGITGRGTRDHWDLALFGDDAAGAVMDRWEVLAGTLPVRGAVHARQVHGAAVRYHAVGLEGLNLVPPCDGHLTRAPGLLLTVSVADCVPVFLVAPGVRAVAAVHAGWRGTAAGILEGAVASFRDRLGVGPGDLHIHLGPAICGACYEVGPEVHEALGEPVPPVPGPVDLADNLARRGIAEGIPPEAVTRSTHCTRCGEAGLFSHRGGDAGRQMAFVGVAG
ncbi:MAG TPA: polyphenol oxidase family protein [Longimicrobiales bacterium]|nr:polyphenol oxidase family protein [Longimicrobiales bacterium]